MSSDDFGKLKYSSNTTNGQDNSQDKTAPNDNSNGYSDEDKQKIYDYFKDYFGN